MSEAGSELSRLRRQFSDCCEEKDRLAGLLNRSLDTDLPLRRRFIAALDELIESRRVEKAPFAVGIIRLDEAYNKIRHTRDRSKALLFKTTRRIIEVIGDRLYQSDRIDEFIALFDSAAVSKELPEHLGRLVAAIQQPHEGPAEDVSFGCRIGLAIYPRHGELGETLLQSAEVALDEGERKRLPISTYSDELGAEYHDRLDLEKDVLKSVRDGMVGFKLHYQPFVDKEFQIRGGEALLRWNDRSRGEVPPSRFIPIAEQTGRILTLGLWVLYQACAEVGKWREAGHDDAYVAVNLAPSQFGQRDLVKRILGVLVKLRLPGAALKLEITEGTVMDNPEAAIAKMHELRTHGIRISIDDFGMGFSSLNSLSRFPIDTLKIDKSFIDGIGQNRNEGIVLAIIGMAASLGIETLAEGVETKAQVDFLVENGCHYIQGFYFGKPVPAEDFRVLLRSGGRVCK